MMKAKILIVGNPLNQEGGVANYYTLFFQNFKSDSLNIKHFPIGSRYWTYYFSILNILLYPFYYLFDLVKYFLLLLFDRKIKIIQFSPSLLPVSLFRDSLFVIIAKIFNKKVVVFYRGWRIHIYEIIKNNFVIKCIFNFIFQKNTKQITLGEFFQKSLHDLYSINAIENIEITTTAISKENIILSNHKNQSHINVLFLARIEPLKGINEIIDSICKLKSINRLKDFKFTIVGYEGKNSKGYIHEIQKILNKNKIGKDKVRFIGKLTGKDKFKIYSENDIYLFPSYTEGCPTSVLEALASGLFCICTKVGSLPDIINDKNGMLIDVKNTEDIVSRLLECSQNRELLNQRNKISSKAILKFDIMHICEKFKVIYNNLLIN